MPRLFKTTACCMLAIVPFFAGCEDKPDASKDPFADMDMKGGKRHDPAIKKDAVEAGHWYCDMGTVHFTRAEKGDGKCAICEMDLVHNDPAAAASGAPSADASAKP